MLRILAGKRSKLWTTFNEPGVAAMCGYIVGNHPPGKLLHFRVGMFAPAPHVLMHHLCGAWHLLAMCV